MKFPLIVKWSITDRCNLRCKHCYRSNRINEITREEADLIIEELYKNKVGCVALTGGEPCLAQEFIYIVELLHEKGIKTEIATNGYYITDDMINMFKKNQISIIQISVDGYNKKVNDFIRGAGTFEIIKNNIKLLLDNGIKVVIAHTLNHYNCRYMDYMVNFFHEIKATALRFEVYIPICEDRFNLKLDIEDIKFIKRKFKTYDKYNNIVIPNHYTNCGAGKYMAMINSDMSMSPCDLLCDKVKSKMSININHNISDIWNNDVVLKSWKNYEYSGCKLTTEF